MLELGFNVTEYGKVILAACFVNDVGTVIALGLIFAPFTMRTAVFVVASVLMFVVLPFVTPRFFRRYGGRVSELEAKYILLALFGMGGVALWADSEPVLPAYLIGMVLAGAVGKDHALVRRLRALTFGRRPDVYSPLMMATGLTFGTISALFGLSRGVITPAQYSHLVAAVIGSAVIPTLIANAFFIPRPLLPESVEAAETVAVTAAASDTTS